MLEIHKDVTKASKSTSTVRTLIHKTNISHMERKGQRSFRSHVTAYMLICINTKIKHTQQQLIVVNALSDWFVILREKFDWLV